MLKRYGFPTALRIRTRAEYQRVFRLRKRLFTPYFIIYYRRNQQDTPTLGVITSKRNIKHAVGRNRVKRIVREAFRQKQHQLSGLDMVFVVQKGAKSATNVELWQCLDEQFVQLAKRSSKP